MVLENKIFSSDNDIIAKIAKMIQVSYKYETASGIVNGINKNFTSSVNFSSSSLIVFIDGKLTLNFTVSGNNSFILTSAPVSGVAVVIGYVPQDFSG